MSTGVFSYLHEDLIQMITKLLLEENKVQETLNVAYADTRLKLLHNDTFWEGRCKEKGWIQKVPTISWEENYIWYLGQQAYWDQITLVNRIDSQIDGRAISHFMRSSMSDWNNEWHIYNSEREKDVHAAYPSHKFSVENSWIRTPMDAKKKERHVIYTATSNDGMHFILTTRLYRCNRPFMYITLYNFNQANKKFELEKELLGEYGVDEAYCKLISPPIISPYNDFVAYVFNFRGEHSTKSYSKFLERYVDYGSMTKCFLTHLSNTKYSRDFECGPIACIAFDNSSIHTPGRLLISSTDGKVSESYFTTKDYTEFYAMFEVFHITINGWEKSEESDEQSIYYDTDDESSQDDTDVTPIVPDLVIPDPVLDIIITGKENVVFYTESGKLYLFNTTVFLLSDTVHFVQLDTG